MSPAAVDEFEYVEMYMLGQSPSGKTDVFGVYNRRSGDRLGSVRWWGPWHEYVFDPSTHAVFSAGCLRDIATFVEDRSGVQRRGWLRPWQVKV